MIKYTLKTHGKVECVFAAGGGKASTKEVDPGFDGSKSATRWKRFK